MSCAKEKNFIDSDDDELPSLVDRILNFKRPQSVLPCKEVFDSGSDDDDVEFLNLIEKVSKTPQIISNKNGTSNKENMSENIKSSYKTFRTPQSQVKYQNTTAPTISSDSEDDFFKVSGRIHNTSQNRNPDRRDLCTNMSDIPEKKKLFSCSNITEKNSESPHGQIKRTPFTPINSNKKGMSNKENVSKLLKPLVKNCETPHFRIKSQNTVVSAVSSDSEDEVEFLKFSERIRITPHSQKSHHQNTWPTASPAVYFSSESDDESEFLKFSERIRNTPQSQNVIRHADAITSDSEDDVFLKLSQKFHHLCTPRSQNQNPVDESSPLSGILERKNVFPATLEGNNSNGEGVPDSLKLIQSTNLKEYEILFPSKSEIPELFLRNREKYSHQLFDFFNRKIFNSQLPSDLPLIWDDRLLLTAGITHCSANNMEPSSFTCTINLSTGLLTSFDRLQDTLLHEMCHAAVWIINNGIKIGHGPLWRIWAARCTWILPCLKCPERCHNYGGQFRIWYYCPKCNWKRGRCKQSHKFINAKCRQCKIPILMTLNDLWNVK